MVHTDAADMPRLMDGNSDGLARIDRGAFEAAGAIGPFADANCDGIVNLADLLQVVIGESVAQARTAK
jgi:hypothetical protein